MIIANEIVQADPSVEVFGGCMVAFKVYHGELCYKSTDDDQSYGMWCPVDENYHPPFPDGTKFYTAPPQRQWVGLTDDETQDIVFDNLGVESLTGEKMSVYDAFLLGVNATEAKLKEKNT